MTTTFYSGDVLYQDNTASHPYALKTPSGLAPGGAQHFSGASGDKQCNQLVVQGACAEALPGGRAGDVVVRYACSTTENIDRFYWTFIA